jgi:hypothetical protein
MNLVRNVQVDISIKNETDVSEIIVTMNFFFFFYGLASNAKFQSSDTGALFFCSYDPSVVLKRKDSAKECIAKRNKGSEGPHPVPHTAATQTPSLL